MASGLGTHQHELRGVVGMARRVMHGHEPAERAAEHHGLCDIERVAHAHHVVGPSVEVPAGRIILTVTPALAAVVDVHHVMGICEPIEVRAERRVVEPRPTVEEEQRGLLDHRFVGRSE